MAADDIFLLRTQFRSHARLWTINQHYKDDTGIDDKFASTDLTDAWDATNRALALDTMAADTTIESLYSVKLTGGDAMPSADVIQSVPGDIAGESLPPNNCAVVSLGSLDPALIRPGRLYVAGIPKGNVLDGNLDAVFLATFTSKWQAIALNTLNGALGNWTPQIFLTVLAGAPRVPPIGVDVDSVRVKPVLYSQRRRNSRQGGAT